MGNTPVAGSGYLAQLYAGPAGILENELKPSDAIVDFRTGVAAGFVHVGENGTRSIPDVVVGEAAVVQIPGVERSRRRHLRTSAHQLHLCELDRPFPTRDGDESTEFLTHPPP